MRRAKTRVDVNIRPLLVVSFGVLAACADAQNAPAETLDMFSGVWENDRGSHVILKDDHGLLSGYYQTNVGEPEKTQKFPLTGFAQGDQITFTVNFKGYGSMTSWTGQLTEDASGSYIRTLWNLTRDVEDADEDDDLWKSITAGASEFRQVN